MDPSLVIKLKAKGVKIPFPAWDGRERVRVAPASDTVSGIIKGVGLHEEAWQQEISKDWKDLAGPQIAANCRPGPLQGKIQVLYVKHSIWLQELKRYGERELLKKLQEKYGRNRIRGIRSQLDPDA